MKINKKFFINKLEQTTSELMEIEKIVRGKF